MRLSIEGISIAAASRVLCAAGPRWLRLAPGQCRRQLSRATTNSELSANGLVGGSAQNRAACSRLASGVPMNVPCAAGPLRRCGAQSRRSARVRGCSAPRQFVRHSRTTASNGSVIQCLRELRDCPRIEVELRQHRLARALSRRLPHLAARRADRRSWEWTELSFAARERVESTIALSLRRSSWARSRASIRLVPLAAHSARLTEEEAQAGVALNGVRGSCCSHSSTRPRRPPRPRLPRRIWQSAAPPAAGGQRASSDGSPRATVRPFRSTMLHGCGGPITSASDRFGRRACRSRKSRKRL